MTEYQKVRLSCAHGPDTHFEGMLVHEYTTQNRDATKDRWTELRLWETRAGAWVAESVGCSTRDREREIREATVIKPTVPVEMRNFPDGRTEIDVGSVEVDHHESRTSVMEAFGWTSAAKAFAREMGWDVIKRVE